MLPFYGHTIMIKTPIVVPDSYGNEVTDFASATSVQVRGHVQPVGSEEFLGARERDQVVSDYRIWLDPGATITALDRLQWVGIDLVIDGEPKRWSNRLGTRHHLEILASVSAG